MKKSIAFLLAFLPFAAFAQLGLKAGLNFAKVSKASNINSSTKSGFHAGGFWNNSGSKLFGSRSELLFSRQGYDYQSSSTGEVNLDYIQLGQMLTINPVKQFSLMFGAQTAYLVSARVDSTSSSNTPNTGSSSDGKNFMDLFNRVDYGYAVGVELRPFSGLLIGARYNVSLAKVYKDMQNFQRPSFTSEDAKNNVIQLSVGWRFGYGKDKKDVSATQ